MASDSLRVHVLDMNDRKYGDCIVCEQEGRRILIDAGRGGDQSPHGGYPSIPDQLRKIFGSPPPHRFALLVVTHCHSDHIGCLDKLLSGGIVEADWALMADPRMGFAHGPDGNDARPGGDLPEDLRRLLPALREDARGDMSDDELAAFLEDARTLEDTYADILDRLEQAGTRVFRYGRDDASELVDAMKDFGLRILGPDDEHLRICAERLFQLEQDNVDMLRGLPASDRGPARPMDLYRRLAGGNEADATDAAGKGAILNDMSIVLVLKAAGNRILLPGDMQLAAPEVPGLDPSMAALRERIRSQGPYDFVKVGHHSSYNGLNEAVYGDMGGCPIFAHSGGDAGTSHPHPSVLKLLSEHQDDIWWLRTDRNGLISLELSPAEYAVSWDRGKLNDFQSGSDDTVVVAGREPSGGAVAEVRRAGGEQIEVIARLPHSATKVRLSIEVEPGDAAASPAARANGSAGDRRVARKERLPRARTLNLANGRDLPRLLFATDRRELANRIGPAAVERLFVALEKASHVVVSDLRAKDSAAECARRVRDRVNESAEANRDVHGVVLLGGYDVVPSHRLDAIGAEVRDALSHSGDSDNFIVWSDDPYGDRDGDVIPELPVSRVPDGGSADLMFAALSTPGMVRAPRTRFGVRNQARPYAEVVFEGVPGGGDLIRSGPTTVEQLPPDTRADATYLLLHGQANDATAFWGEEGGNFPEAFNLDHVPAQFDGVLLTGSCWGALVVDRAAYRAPTMRPRGRRPDNSIALAYLQAGAQAFVGCTGSHYSPTVEPWGYFGQPLHESFWRLVKDGASPAQALFEAKREYVAGLPHRKDATVRDVAIELKILRQFTCLGLGW